MNGDGSIIAVNKAWKTFGIQNGYNHATLGIGDNYLEVAENATGKEALEARYAVSGIRKVIKGQTDQFSMEYSCNSATEKRWFRLIASPLNIRESGAVVMHINITEEKMATDLLSRSEANLRAIFDSTVTAFTLLDQQFNIIAFNPKAASMVAEVYEQPLLNGRNFVHYYTTAADKQRVETVLQKVLEGEVIVSEICRTDITGKTRWYIVRMSRIAVQETATGICVATLDITEKKLHDLEREKLTNDLLQRNQHLQQFTYIVSHNLRGPVANIIAFTEELKDNTYNEEYRQLFIRELSNSVSKLDSVIKDLNQILQVNKEVAQARETISLSQLVDNIRNSISNVIQEKAVAIETDFTKAKTINTIKTYVHSIFYNLISNSIKYHQPGIAPHIRISSAATEENVIITFQDNGSGIDLHKKKDQVFGLYKRFHNHVEGKGMGLFMTKAQVEALGGTIQIKSQVNSGTTFIISFPK